MVSFAGTIQEIYSLNPGYWRVHSLSFVDISKYWNDKESFANIKFNSRKGKDLFKALTGHPLLLWHLELIQNTVIVPFDLITNITTNENYSGVTTLGNTNFVHNPCLICKYGDFANTYNKRSEYELYVATRNLVEEYRTRTLLSVLNANVFDGSILFQQNYQGLINIGLKK